MVQPQEPVVQPQEPVVQPQEPVVQPQEPVVQPQEPTGPVDYPASKARWKIEPKLILPNDVLEDLKNPRNKTSSYQLQMRMTIDKQGNVTNATVISGSGDGRVDNAAIQAAKKAKLYPFTQNGKPVVGIIVYPMIHKINQ